MDHLCQLTSKLVHLFSNVHKFYNEQTGWKHNAALCLPVCHGVGIKTLVSTISLRIHYTSNLLSSQFSTWDAADLYHSSSLKYHHMYIVLELCLYFCIVYWCFQQVAAISSLAENVGTCCTSAWFMPVGSRRWIVFWCCFFVAFPPFVERHWRPQFSSYVTGGWQSCACSASCTTWLGWRSEPIFHAVWQETVACVAECSSTRKSTISSLTFTQLNICSRHYTYRRCFINTLATKTPLPQKVRIL